jgi:hypothetical protein
MPHPSALLLLLPLSAAPAIDSVARSDTGYQPSDVRSAAVGGAALRVYQDPMTGELIDSPRTPDQRVFSQTSATADYSRVRLTREADGAWVVSGTPRMSVMLRQDADGTVQQYCVPEPAGRGGEQP